MGMTIDKAISWLISIAEHEGEDIPIYDTDVEAIKVAIDTMRKYQKIEQMVKQYKKFGNIDFSMQIICGVVEDGNND